jgi:hypothetical protein
MGSVYLLSYLVLGGPAPPPPGPEDCGPAVTLSVGCESYAPCAE